MGLEEITVSQDDQDIVHDQDKGWMNESEPEVEFDDEEQQSY